MPPQHTSGRAEVDFSSDDESLYRRYLASHFRDGELDPSAIRFNEPPSFLRSAYSVPADALHADCADQQSVSKYGVLAMPVSAARHRERARDGEVFDFLPIHRHLPPCYAHSEIHCASQEHADPQHAEPPKEVIWCDPVNSCKSVGWFLFLSFKDKVSSSRGR